MDADLPTRAKRVHITTLSYRSFFFLLLLVVSIVFFLVVTEPAKEAPVREIAPVQVEATAVRREDLHPRLLMTGYLQPARKAKLHFELSGQVIERRVEAGQAVRAGALLMRLAEGDFLDKAREAEARLEQEKAAIERDRQLLKYVIANRELQEAEVARMEKLGEASLASQSKYGETVQNLLRLQVEEENLRYSVEVAEARLQLREAALRQARRNVGRTRLKAPFDGVVNAVHVEKGDYVTPSQVVAEVVQIDDMDLYVEVDGGAAAALDSGRLVTVETAAGPREGRVIAIQRDPDPETFTFGVRIRVDGAGLVSGSLARAEIGLPALRDVLTVPVAAIARGEESAVFIVRDGVVARVPVKPGRRVEGRQVVNGALRAGDQVVSRDVALLQDGLRVIVRQP